MSDKLIFCMQISMKAWYKLILWFWWGWWRITKVPKITSLQCFYCISKKKVRDEDDFLDEEKHQSFLQVNINILGIKFFCKVMLSLLIGMIILKVLKVTSLQYLYSISKKKLGMEFILCMQINIEVSTSWHFCFL